MQRHNFLHELHILHQPHDVVREELHGGHSAHAAGVKSRWMHVAPFHQAEHLAGHAADLQSLEIESARERIQRLHDVADGFIAMQFGVRRGCLLRLLPDTGIGFLHHRFAKIHADQVVLKDVVVEHVFGGFAKVDNPLRHRRRPHTERHVLRVGGAGGVVIAADPADAAGDEVRIARIFALHEDAVAAEDRRGAVTLGNFALAEVDFGEDAEAAHDPGNRIPVHLN